MFKTSHALEYSEQASGGALYIGIAALCIFAFFRPITVSFHHVGSVSILDIFGIASSYLLLLALAINLKNIRLPYVSYAILLYALYCLISIAWGSEYRDVVRAIVPFLPFFLAAAVVRNERHVLLLIGALSFGYTLPVVGSAVLILSGKSAVTVTGSMLERQAGLSSGVHTAGHLMLFFSFIFVFYRIVAGDRKRLHQLFMAVLLAGSLFCAYKTFTRTIFLGGMVFWSAYLWFTSKRLFAVFAIVLLLVSIFRFSDIRSMVMQKQEEKTEFDVNSAGSGRESLWRHNLTMFAGMPLTSQLLGVGLGNEQKLVPGTRIMWAGSHNDYLSLLVTVGVFGLLLYLGIYGINLLAVILSRWRRESRVFALCFLVSVILMNFVSNSYIVRFQMAQLFWFLMGLLYAYGMMQRKSETDAPRYEGAGAQK
jgi:O-antigen ligase